MNNHCIAVLLCLPLVVGCPGPQTNTESTNTALPNAVISEPTSVKTNLPTDEFLIDADESAQPRISQVLSEMATGYGGTLVCDPEDHAIDSSAFVERYLAKFADPSNLKDYDYRFERLLARVTQFPKSLDDARLDNSIWLAFQTLENKHPGKTGYFHGDTNYILDSARDLMWTYLNVHAQRILNDEHRRSFWRDRLLASTGETQQLTQSFALLHLLASTQTATPELTLWDVDSNESIPAGSGGLNWYCHRISSRWITMGFDPEVLPSPRVDNISSGRWERSNAIDQKSWSAKRTGFDIGYTRLVGQRVVRYSIRVPTQLTDDGIFFFPYNEQIYIWQKRDFHAGVLRMAQISGFIDENSYAKILNCLGLDKIEITARKER